VVFIAEIWRLHFREPISGVFPALSGVDFAPKIKVLFQKYGGFIADYRNNMMVSFRQMKEI
jgi:hypothetical protein